ncbi:MAG TPA: cell division protein ZapA [Alphaproteobacteria bacterium]|jgi:cell division protein ZapA|nr:cell division protein ZapA [Alphaproteobacteria bacterium]
MAQVEVTVNGRAYVVACEDGEETHLEELAEYLNGQVKELAESLGQVGEARLILMAGLLLADELFDAVARIKTLQSEVEAAGQAGKKALSEAGAQAAGDMGALTKRIDEVAQRLQSA